MSKRKAAIRLKVKKSVPNELRFDVYKDANSRYRWRLIAKNNRIIADSGEGYHNEVDALSGIALVISANRATPVVVDRTPAV